MVNSIRKKSQHQKKNGVKVNIALIIAITYQEERKKFARYVRKNSQHLRVTKKFIKRLAIAQDLK